MSDGGHEETIRYVYVLVANTTIVATDAMEWRNGAIGAVIPALSLDSGITVGLLHSLLHLDGLSLRAGEPAPCQ
jgi:hypothetical protein